MHSQKNCDGKILKSSCGIPKLPSKTVNQRQLYFARQAELMLSEQFANYRGKFECSARLTYISN